MRFAITERFGLEFRAEGFDVFNHHNFYADETNLAYSGSLANPQTTPVSVSWWARFYRPRWQPRQRRFGQFALRATF
jgi:hypothetical protein